MFLIHTLNLAAFNLLLELRDEFVADVMLRRLVLNCQISVIDPGSSHFGGRSVMTTVYGDGVVRRAETWPPTVWHEIFQRPKRGAVLLAAGPTAVYVRRLVYEKKMSGCWVFTRAWHRILSYARNVIQFNDIIAIIGASERSSEFFA